MRNAFRLLLATTCLAFLSLLGPAASGVPAGLERGRACLVAAKGLPAPLACQE
jgi:hypothetical protein